SIVLPVSVGQHTIIVSAYNSSGRTDSAPFVIGPAANAGGPYNGQVGVSLAVDGSGSTDSTGTIASYAWDWGDGTTSSSSSSSASHAYGAAGTFNVTLTVSDSVGASSPATTTATILNQLTPLSISCPGPLSA